MSNARVLVFHHYFQEEEEKLREEAWKNNAQKSFVIKHKKESKLLSLGFPNTKKRIENQGEAKFFLPNV